MKPRFSNSVAQVLGVPPDVGAIGRDVRDRQQLDCSSRMTGCSFAVIHARTFATHGDCAVSAPATATEQERSASTSADDPTCARAVLRLWPKTQSTPPVTEQSGSSVRRCCAPSRERTLASRRNEADVVAVEHVDDLGKQRQAAARPVERPVGAEIDARVKRHPHLVARLREEDDPVDVADSTRAPARCCRPAPWR